MITTLASDAEHWLADDIREMIDADAPEKITAAMDRARRVLPPGADFSEVWAEAAFLDPAAFGDETAAGAVQRPTADPIAAALSQARELLPPEAGFARVWASAAEIAPAAFGDEGPASAAEKCIANAVTFAKVTAGRGADFAEVWRIAASLDPAAFNS
jgi:hypothetical protein